MTWHLKDRELEKKLEEFSGGNFVNSLNKEIESDGIDSEFFVWVAFGRKLSGDDNKENCLLFRMDEIEEVPEYNPKAWNEFPKVKPPYNMMMRIKMKNGYLRAGYLKKFPDGDSWVNPNGVLMCNAENAEIELFRPWED